jgi:hypothetical protein
LGGYAGAKQLCQTARNGSPSAHLCTTEELLRSEAMGVAWPGSDEHVFASGLSLYDLATSASYQDDCQGFSSSAASKRRSVYYHSIHQFRLGVVQQQRLVRLL